MPEQSKAKKPGDQKVQAKSAAPQHQPSAGPAGPAWAGQSAAGPLALGGVQRKVNVGQEGDSFEREAEHAGDKVASGGKVQMSSLSSVEGSSLSRMSKPEEKKGDDKKADSAPVQKADDKKPDEKKAVQKADD